LKIKQNAVAGKKCAAPENKADGAENEKSDPETGFIASPHIVESGQETGL